MDLALLVARLVLAAVFGLAGLAKLADRSGSRQALIDFGLPAALAAPLGRLLPLAELAIALALIPLATAWWATLGALALLLLFVAGIAANLARGRAPDCHCFGQLHSSPAGPETLLRNLALAAVAGLVAWQGPGASAVAWLGDLSAAERAGMALGVLSLALLGGLVWLLYQVLRQQGRLLLRLDTIEARLTGGGMAPAAGAHPSAPRGLPVGSVAPSFSLPDLDGHTHSLESLRAAGKDVLLIFVDPNCGPCNALLPDVGHWQREHAEQLTIALVSRGAVEANRPKAAEHGVGPVLLQNDFEVAMDYQSYGTPGAVMIRADGTIGSPTAQGATEIQRLVGFATGREELPVLPRANGHAAPTAPPGLKPGEPAPPIVLPELGGRTVSLEEFRGSKTLVLFWNPGCGFCQQMLPDLKEWEAAPPEGAPRLLVVSTGSPEENRTQGIRAPLLLDPAFVVAPSYGANGTPMGVLVDGEGRIASEMAIGAPAVWALAGTARTDPQGAP